MDNRSYSKGISWIDDCRIPFVDEGDTWNNQVAQDIRGKTFIGVQKGNLDLIKNHNKQGRFPANLLVSDDMLNDGSITKQNTRRYNEDTCGGGMFPITSNGRVSVGDKGSNSRYYDIDKWFNNLIDV
jgi:hypothetical protein